MFDPDARAVTDLLADRLVPDELWSLLEPLLPAAPVRPQGGGRARVDQRPLFAAMVYALVGGVAFRQIPARFGVSQPTLCRKWAQCRAAGVWQRLLEAALCEHDPWAQTVARVALTRDNAGYGAGMEMARARD
jgi:transposase